MATKKQNHQVIKRMIRRKEKNSTVFRDIMMGNACRRRYGGGLATNDNEKS